MFYIVNCILRYTISAFLRVKRCMQPFSQPGCDHLIWFYLVAKVLLGGCFLARVTKLTPEGDIFFHVYCLCPSLQIHVVSKLWWCFYLSNTDVVGRVHWEFGKEPKFKYWSILKCYSRWFGVFVCRCVQRQIVMSCISSVWEGVNGNSLWNVRMSYSPAE